MGAADAVPGVSGGTVAFITGIYQELIESISKLDLKALSVLVKQGPRAFWHHINGAFLCVLVSGILTSLLLLSSAVLYALAQYPLLLWGGFFGLITASTVVMARQIEGWTPLGILLFTLAALGAWQLSSLGSASVELSYINVFIAGMLAICAMILPGISGSFILLLLGMYAHILGAVKGLDIAVLVVFATGCAAGLLSFSKLLSWLFTCYRNLTLALLTGFLLGSLAKVWPWKQVLSTRLNSKGVSVPDLQQNISPWEFSALVADPQLGGVLCAALIGAIAVLAIEKVNK